MMQSQGQIKLNRRGLTELVLACTLISLLTFALWSWQTSGGRITAMAMPTQDPQSALLPKIILDPVIMLATIVAEFTLLLAFTLAIVPSKWWLRIDRYFDAEPNEPATPLEWLGHKITSHKVPAHAQAQFNQAGEPVYYEAPPPGTNINPYSAPPNQQTGVQPGQPVPGQLQPGQPVPGQLQPGQPVPGQLQPGQPVPGQLQPGQPAAGTEVQPQAANAAAAPVAPPVPLSDVLNFEDEPTDDPLADLTDIGDILTSAFDEDDGIDPDREALGKSLDDVDIKAILKSSRNVLATFKQ